MKMLEERYNKALLCIVRKCGSLQKEEDEGLLLHRWTLGDDVAVF